MTLLRLKKDKNGQFIIIATLLIAIMIISVASIMYGAVTYFRHERWEEYLAVIDAVEINSHRLVEISLANYTMLVNQTGNQTVLRASMDKWQRDLMKTYTGLGIVLASNLTNGPQDIYGVTIQYNMGLATDWNEQESFSAANATFDLNITSVGLYGYKFTTPVFLKMNIIDALWYEGEDSNPNEIGVRLIIQRENLIPVINLQAANFIEFQVNGENKTFTFDRYFDSKTLNAFVYELSYVYGDLNPETLDNVTISVVNAQGIKVTGQVSYMTVIDAE